jgi:hypothetical protein
MASKRKTEKAFNVLASFSKRKICPSPPKATKEGLCRPSHFCAENCIKWPESNIAWASLSLKLSKHGRVIVICFSFFIEYLFYFKFSDVYRSVKIVEKKQKYVLRFEEEKNCLHECNIW